MCSQVIELLSQLKSIMKHICFEFEVYVTQAYFLPGELLNLNGLIYSTYAHVTNFYEPTGLIGHLYSQAGLIALLDASGNKVITWKNLQVKETNISNKQYVISCRELKHEKQ